MILTFFYYKVSFLIKSEGDLFEITKFIYNHTRLTLFPNLKVLLNLMFYRYEGPGWMRWHKIILHRNT
jgi:hypothetical protein